jgi:hypothetical protein
MLPVRERVRAPQLREAARPDGDVHGMHGERGKRWTAARRRGSTRAIP